jgi:Outer membrane protein beta-barrel domain
MSVLYFSTKIRLDAMKKYIFLVGLVLGATVAHAQGRLGVKVSPGISFNRVHTSPPNVGFSSIGAALGFQLGAAYDYSVKNNYCVGTGLFYAIQRIAVKNEELSFGIKEAHALYYLQIPLLLKLYTSELALDTRLYVALGGLGQVRINERNTELRKNQKTPFIETFRRWGFAGLLEIGMEYDIGLSTSVFGGISYQYGLSSVIDKHTQENSRCAVKGYNDLVSIDLGVRF